MEHSGPIERLLKHDAWANRETLASLRAMKAPSRRAEALLAHIVAAEWLWLQRMQDEPASMPVWPQLSLTACGIELERLGRAWSSFLNDAVSGDLARVVRYTNSKGEAWSNTVGDILLHVAMHSSYHRGQIASSLADAQETPAYTDFIHCVRQGRLDGVEPR